MWANGPAVRSIIRCRDRPREAVRRYVTECIDEIVKNNMTEKPCDHVHVLSVDVSNSGLDDSDVELLVALFARLREHGVLIRSFEAARNRITDAGVKMLYDRWLLPQRLVAASLAATHPLSAIPTPDQVTLESNLLSLASADLLVGHGLEHYPFDYCRVRPLNLFLNGNSFTTANVLERWSAHLHKICVVAGDSPCKILSCEARRGSRTAVHLHASTRPLPLHPPARVDAATVADRRPPCFPKEVREALFSLRQLHNCLGKTAPTDPSSP